MEVTTEITLEPGQVWVYECRPQEPSSRIVIQGVEVHERIGEIVHIGVVHVSLPGPSGIIDEITHLPYSGAALRPCLIALESSGNPVLEDYPECYAEWREAFDAGEAGVFTLDVAGVIDGFEKAQGA